MAYLKDVSSLCCVQQQQQQCVLRLFLFVVLLNLFCQMETVEVIISRSCVSDDSCNCSDPSAIQSDLPVMCPNLSYALSTWNKYQPQELTFTLNEDQYLQGRNYDFLLYQVYNISILGNGNWVHCNDSTTISMCDYTPNNNKRLVIANTVFYKCGHHGGDTFTICPAWGHLVNVTFLNIVGGINIYYFVNLTIESCIFQNCSTTPYAALRITKFLVNRHSEINLKNCSFLHNIEDSKYLGGVKGQSGVLAIAFPNDPFKNLRFFNVSVKIQSCLFQGNIMQFSGSQSPMFYLSGIFYSNISVSFENCTFKDNVIEYIGIEIIYPEGNNLSIVFRNTSFIGSRNFINPSSNVDYGLLHVSNDVHFPRFNGTTEIVYDRVHFERNNGTLLYVSSTGYSKHTLNDCTFSGNLQTVATPTMLSFTGNPYYCTNWHPYDDCNTYVILTNITITDDAGFHGYVDMPFKYNRSIFFFNLVNLTAENLTLSGNYFSIATMMVLDTAVSVTFTGNNTFQHNQGVYGGALSVINSSSITIAVDSVLTFINNYADYGGAIYFESSNFRDILNCQGTVVADNNNARIAGDLLYSTNPNITGRLNYFDKCFQLINSNSMATAVEHIATVPTLFNISQRSIELYAGQIIKFNVTLLDGLNNLTSCKARISLMCNTSDGDDAVCETIDSHLLLVGPSEIYLRGNDTPVNTLLYIAGPNYNDDTIQDLKPKLKVTCIDPYVAGDNEMNIIIKWTQCPNGFPYNSDSRTCHCIDRAQIQCIPDSNVACIKKGLWTNGNITVSCPYPLCSTQYNNRSALCQRYPGLVALPHNISDQCAFNRNGTRCSGCQNGYYFTFEGVHCANHCKSHYPYLLIVFAFGFQFLIFTLVLATVRLKLEIGLGFLYGPVFFLAIIGQMQFGYHGQLRVLKVIVSTFSSIFLLNLEVFGEIPLCFGKLMNLFVLHSFYYLGPFLIWAMLLLLVVMSRCCSRLLSKVQDSPIQAICLLIMLSFWSVANTSIQLLKSLKIDNYYFTEIDPNIRYFHGEHAAFGLLAIAVLLLMILPFIGFLAISNFSALYYVFRLYRFKPILDEFQSCYQDKYRWYSVVYYIFWILYLVLVPYPPGPQVLLVLLLTLHFIIQPYKRHILNVIDMLLLLDLLFLTSLLNEEEETENMRVYTVLIYIMTLFPLVYVMVGCVGIFVMQCHNRFCPIMKKKETAISSVMFTEQPRQRNPPTCEVVIDRDEREPLLRILQDDKV